MTDVKPYIARLLSDIAGVELAFPACPERLPVIILTETGNDVSVILSGRDRYSVITLQTDVYAEDAQTVTALAVQVNERLAALGIRRGFSQLITDERYPRMCMRYRFGVDEVSGRVVAL